MLFIHCYFNVYVCIHTHIYIYIYILMLIKVHINVVYSLLFFILMYTLK